MRKIQQTLLKISFVGLFMILLAGCNLPANADETMGQNAAQTAAAQTEAASLQEQPTETQAAATATATEPAGSNGSGDQTGTQTSDLTPTATQDTSATPTSTEEEIGEDRAEFITDVTIPDYSEVQTGEEITKTWRLRNSGTSTWTTEYVVDFEKGEKLGASTQIKLPKSVKPNEFVDISIKFTVPDAAGEYSSYWILKNADGQRVGVAEEGKFITLFMIINAVGDAADGGSSSSGGIAGGAKVTNATVSVDTPNFSGSCPAQLTFTYKVTTSNAGKVNFQLKFGVVSPTGYKFDPPPQYTENFTGGYTVTYTYTLFSANSVNATVKVEAVGSNTLTSAPASFKVNCK